MDELDKLGQAKQDLGELNELTDKLHGWIS